MYLGFFHSLVCASRCLARDAVSQGSMCTTRQGAELFVERVDPELCSLTRRFKSPVLPI